MCEKGARGKEQPQSGGGRLGTEWRGRRKALKCINEKNFEKQVEEEKAINKKCVRPERVKGFL
jgi:hypothetical protein